MPVKYVFVTGGVVSGLGKGITAASLGRLLKARGYHVTMQKFDPYINIDPGTMNPVQHGEVFVTEDGVETDLDLGHYERFIDENLTKNSNDPAFCLYLSLLSIVSLSFFLLGDQVVRQSYKYNTTDHISDRNTYQIVNITTDRQSSCCGIHHSYSHGCHVCNAMLKTAYHESKDTPHDHDQLS